MSRRKQTLVFGFVALLAVGWWAYTRFGPWTPTLADADRITAVEVWIDYDWDERENSQPKRLLARSEHPVAIRRLLEAMAPAEPTPAHKCGYMGRIVFTRTDGNRMEIPYLPGHSRDWYELLPPFRPALTYMRVPKPAFLAAMKGLGVNELPLECGKGAKPLP
ncbi:MAG: hypothetical protein U0871_29945 [Gemmataceae bacterium]